jgi:plastocyanin
VYQAIDSSVTVDSAGLVTALYPTTQTQVIAKLQDVRQNMTHADTVIIQVTDTVPQYAPATFSIQPMPGDLDSAKVAVDQPFVINQGNQNLPVYAADAGGDSLCTDFSGCFIPVYFTSSNPAIASIDRTSGVITPNLIGHVTFYATTLVYGTVLSDSLPFEVGNRISLARNQISVNAFTKGPPHAFSPQTVTIGVGGRIVFLGVCEHAVDTVDVAFDNLNAATGTGGDSARSPIVNSAFLLTSFTQTFPSGTSFQCPPALVTFPNKGTFTYHSRRLGRGGTIIVRD